eukprot:230278-Chlamydomonas_euryale.AAC.10
MRPTSFAFLTSNVVREIRVPPGFARGGMLPIFVPQCKLGRSKQRMSQVVCLASGQVGLAAAVLSHIHTSCCGICTVVTNLRPMHDAVQHQEDLKDRMLEQKLPVCNKFAGCCCGPDQAGGLGQHCLGACPLKTATSLDMQRLPSSSQQPLWHGPNFKGAEPGHGCVPCTWSTFGYLVHLLCTAPQERMQKCICSPIWCPIRVLKSRLAYYECVKSGALDGTACCMHAAPVANNDGVHAAQHNLVSCLAHSRRLQSPCTPGGSAKRSHTAVHGGRLAYALLVASVTHRWCDGAPQPNE